MAAAVVTAGAAVVAGLAHPVIRITVINISATSTMTMPIRINVIHCK
jgi:hypothetical protein